MKPSRCLAEDGSSASHRRQTSVSPNFFCASSGNQWDQDGYHVSACPKPSAPSIVEVASSASGDHHLLARRMARQELLCASAQTRALFSLTLLDRFQIGQAWKPIDPHPTARLPAFGMQKLPTGFRHLIGAARGFDRSKMSANR